MTFRVGMRRATSRSTGSCRKGLTNAFKHSDATVIDVTDRGGSYMAEAPPAMKEPQVPPSST